MKELNELLKENKEVYVCTDCEKIINVNHTNNGSENTYYIGSCIICDKLTFNTISE